MDLYYDFHIHSCLSPCGADEMTPKMIIDCAIAKELDCIALTDHNTSANCEALYSYAKNKDIIVLSGMELQTSEEIHVLCLFAELENALKFGEYVRSKLPKIENRKEIFGAQTVIKPDGTTAEEKQMLLISSEISLYGLYDFVLSQSGIAIPAHIDKNSFSICSAFGYLDKEMGFPLVEIYKNITIAENAGIPYIQSSDAHNIDKFFDNEYHTIKSSEKSPEAVIAALRSFKNE